jgi:S1-C subfamily serine protease
MAFEREILRKIGEVDTKLGGIVARGDEHEARLRTLEKVQTRKSDVRTTLVAGIISLAVAVVNACSSGCMPAPTVQHPTEQDIGRNHDTVVFIDGTHVDSKNFFKSGEYFASGAFIGPDLVLTAGHVCEDNDLYILTSAGGTKFPAFPIYDSDNTPNDTCIMQTLGYENDTWLQIAEQERFGEHVWYEGFPATVPGVFDGRLVGWSTKERVGVDGFVVASLSGYYGASGSAVVDDSGKVVGVFAAINPNFPEQTFLVPLEDIQAAKAAVSTEDIDNG